MKYYQMSNKIINILGSISPEPLSLSIQGCNWLIGHTGQALVDYGRDRSNGEPFVGPLLCTISREEESDFMPELFMSIGLIMSSKLYHDLAQTGLNNLEVHDTLIAGEELGVEIRDYKFVNVMGIRSLESLQRNETSTLDIFLLKEDTNIVLLTEPTYEKLKSKKYKGVLFELFELE